MARHNPSAVFAPGILECKQNLYASTRRLHERRSTLCDRSLGKKAAGGTRRNSLPQGVSLVDAISSKMQSLPPPPPVIEEVRAGAAALGWGGLGWVGVAACK